MEALQPEPPLPPVVEEMPLSLAYAALYERADEARTEFFEREAERYRADLDEAEASSAPSSPACVEISPEQMRCPPWRRPASR
jgi:hypothetical protein